MTNLYNTNLYNTKYKFAPAGQKTEKSAVSKNNTGRAACGRSLRVEKPQNRPVSKRNTGRAAIRADPAGEKHHISSSHADVRRAISTKFCMVIEVVRAIILGQKRFWILVRF